MLDCVRTFCTSVAPGPGILLGRLPTPRLEVNTMPHLRVARATPPVSSLSLGFCQSQSILSRPTFPFLTPVSEARIEDYKTPWTPSLLSLTAFSDHNSIPYSYTTATLLLRSTPSSRSNIITESPIAQRWPIRSTLSR